MWCIQCYITATIPCSIILFIHFLSILVYPDGLKLTIVHDLSIKYGVKLAVIQAYNNRYKPDQFNANAIISTYDLNCEH